MVFCCVPHIKRRTIGSQYLVKKVFPNYLVRVEGGWGEGYPSPQPLALYYRVKTYLPDY